MKYFSYFYQKIALTFHANCRHFVQNVKSYFLNLSSAELARGLVKIKTLCRNLVNSILSPFFFFFFFEKRRFGFLYK